MPVEGSPRQGVAGASTPASPAHRYAQQATQGYNLLKTAHGIGVLSLSGGLCALMRVGKRASTADGQMHNNPVPAEQNGLRAFSIIQLQPMLTILLVYGADDGAFRTRGKSAGVSETPVRYLEPGLSRAGSAPTLHTPSATTFYSSPWAPSCIVSGCAAACTTLFFIGNLSWKRRSHQAPF